ncbi:substrate-binding domain-containing protein [Embleya hyalina]|uniref:Phosphate ABC transporter substrate-binding protein n=1 Tax=Embleya hyalina TaxID=516124 RepID=A0A401YT73_9ACTN|nr:substrate-binding domain-containing protein [Embleya hyalina]GCD97813.1 phosphate ABC transporter substrate-binding protein [Embleya hyalina]
MLGSYRRRTVGALSAALGAAMTLVIGTTTSARAATFVNGGTDSLYNVTRALADDYAFNVDPNGDDWLTAPAAPGAFTFANAACNAYYATHPLPTNADVLPLERAQVVPNCFAFARTDVTPTTPTDLTYIRVAGDAVTWATKKPGAPTNLSKAVLKNIYNCTYTDWSQLPGSTASGAIQKHLPRAEGGLRRNFIKYVLDDFDPTAPANYPCSITVVGTAQPDRGDDPAIGSANAIIAYDASAYRAQTTPATGVVNHTNGFKLGSIDGKAPNTAAFTGNISTYYVIDARDTEIDTNTIAFINWAKAPAQRPIWQLFGFVP